MREKHLHIVTLDVPWPVNFGGVFDLYYKLKWLHEEGVKIHLHCFVKDRLPQPELNKYCETVTYYRRKTFTGISLSLPYIVSSRNSAKLINNLKKDDHPVLLEGIHCTYPLYKNELKNRKVFLRLHNVEYKYYEHLAKHENNIFKKLYFENEARLLFRYENKIARKARTLTVSSHDEEVYKNEFGADDISFLPVFLPWDEISPKPGTGSYCLYHGNLAINENEVAAEWLIKKVFSKMNIPFIIAGNKPSAKLKALVKRYDHITLTDTPSEQEMQQLIENAQINVLPSFNRTGVKLKLLNALYNGRHCLVNTEGTEGSGLDDLCLIAVTPKEFKEQVGDIFDVPFTETAMQHRSAALKKLYNNEANARRLNAWIW